MGKNNSAGQAGASSKVLVLGWDGGCFDLLDRMIDKGVMPHLRALIRRGVRAPLISTIPPLTSPAWTSFRTGKLPANHGLFGFFKAPESSLDITSLERHTARDIPHRAFWNILNEHGKRVCVADMPLTDPVEKIDGVMVSGMMTRGTNGVLAYPESVAQELAAAFPDFFGRTLTDGIDTSAAYLKRLTMSLEWKKQEDLFLMRTYPWDCFVTVFSAVDALQHYFWKYVDTDSRSYTSDTKIYKQIEAFFSTLDDVLKAYLDVLGKDGSVFVVSDHGFGAADYAIYVNNLLEEFGYLKTRQRRELLPKRLSGEALKQLLRRLDVLGLRSRISGRMRNRLKDMMGAGNLPVMWAQTRAVLRVNSEEGVYINVKGKYEDGSIEPEDRERCVKELIRQLAGVINPENGEKVFDDVKPREAVHNGVCQGNAPDVILRPAPGYVIKSYRRGARPVQRHDDPFLCGTHRPEGIFIAAGPVFKSDTCADCLRLEDFVPNLLYASGLPIPEDLDGCICEGLFQPEVLASRRPSYCGPAGKAGRDFGTDVEQSYEEAIRRQLSQLGYID